MVVAVVVVLVSVVVDQNKLFIQSEAFLKNQIRVSFSRMERELLVSHNISDAVSSIQDNPSFDFVVIILSNMRINSISIIFKIIKKVKKTRSFLLKYYRIYWFMSSSKTSKNFSISFFVLYKYVLILALHHMFNDLCSGYAQCHHVRIHILFLEKISHILLKLFSSFIINENVQMRLLGS
ncbi:hypothetical protein IKO50_00350 [bacterium]|nr:hypothetical protein [bacterium]